MAIRMAARIVATATDPAHIFISFMACSVRQICPDALAGHGRGSRWEKGEPGQEIPCPGSDRPFAWVLRPFVPLRIGAYHLCRGYVRAVVSCPHPSPPLVGR
jgi:hypothetical protein